MRDCARGPGKSCGRGRVALHLSSALSRTGERYAQAEFIGGGGARFCHHWRCCRRRFRFWQVPRSRAGSLLAGAVRRVWAVARIIDQEHRQNDGRRESCGAGNGGEEPEGTRADVGSCRPQHRHDRIVAGRQGTHPSDLSATSRARPTPVSSACDWPMGKWKPSLPARRSAIRYGVRPGAPSSSAKKPATAARCSRSSIRSTPRGSCSIA